LVAGLVKSEREGNNRMDKITIALGANEKATNWTNKTYTWQELLEQFKDVRRTSETMKQYDGMKKTEKTKAKSGRAFIGGITKDGNRKKESITKRTLITLDIDHGTAYTLADIELALLDVAYFVYSTHSHRETKPRYRLIVPTNRAMTPDEYLATARKLASSIDMEYFDKTSFEVSRLFYFPSCSSDADPVLEENPGEPLKVDDILAEHDDWRAMSEWERPPSEDRGINQQVGKMEDPRNKEGVIGAFCRAYTITEAIEKFIPDVYERTNDPNRLTLIEGSSHGGAILYQQDTFLYSHHESDQINGKPVNAFDLVRIHKFGHTDEHEKPTTKHTAYKSFKKMLKLARNDDKTASEVAKSDFTDMLKDLAPDEQQAEIEWRKRLTRNDKTGAILSNAQNVELILTNGVFKDVLAFDSFANRKVIKGNLPWREITNEKLDYAPWQGSDDAQLRHYLNKQYDIAHSKTVISDALTNTFLANQVHPVQEFLGEMRWEGNGVDEPLVNTFLIDYFGAADNALSREALRKQLLAGVKRSHFPGAEYHIMLVLVGSQGRGKSSFLKALGLGKWHTDGIDDFDPKKAGELLHGKWIVEISELHAYRKSDIGQVKNFLAKNEDHYRLAYDTDASTFPRQCIFFGTSNDANFLNDPTGARRFVIVEIDQQPRTKGEWKDLSHTEIEEKWAEVARQLWAEAVYFYKQGESLELSPEAQAIAKQMQEKHYNEDPREGLVNEYLETLIPNDFEEMEEWERRSYYNGDNDKVAGTKKREIVCAMQIWVECFNRNKADIKRADSAQIVVILKRLGWVERTPIKARFKNYGVLKAYVRKE